MGLRLGFVGIVVVALAAIVSCGSETGSAGASGTVGTASPRRFDGGAGGQDPKSGAGAGGPLSSGAGW